MTLYNALEAFAFSGAYYVYFLAFRENVDSNGVANILFLIEIAKLFNEFYPTGYLYRSAMNLFRNRTRRLRLEALRRPFGGSPPDAFALIESRDRVARALKGLPPRQRAALVLTDLLGYESAEAAELLKIKPATVRVLAHQAREAIRTRTEPDHD